MGAANAFAALNAAVVSQFASAVTYWPSTGATVIGQSFSMNVIIDTPRDQDNVARGTYVELGANGADFPGTPVEGDQFVLDEGSAYMVQRVEVDPSGFVTMLCRLKSRSIGI